MKLYLRPLCLVATIVTLCIAASAQRGVVQLCVVDPDDKIVKGVVLKNKGIGTPSNPTNDTGNTKIIIPKITNPGDFVDLVIVQDEKEKEQWILLSPWNGRIAVPPFDGKPDRFVTIVIAKKFDRHLLANDKALAALTASILHDISPKVSGESLTDDQRQRALNDIAEKYGLQPAELDKAIRAWGIRAKDPYEIGLAALYARNLPEAEKQLLISLELREKEEEQKKAEVADAAFYLGQTFYEQGKYHDSVTAYRKALARRPDDALTIHNLAVSLMLAASYAEAEPLYSRSLAIKETALGKDHPSVATTLNNLASLYFSQGKYADAEPLYTRSLAIKETALGKDHPDVATTLNNLAVLYESQGKFAEAEPLYKRALAILEKAFGEVHPYMAQGLENYAVLLKKMNREAEALEMEKRAKAIRSRLK